MFAHRQGDGRAPGPGPEDPGGKQYTTSSPASDVLAGSGAVGPEAGSHDARIGERHLHDKWSAEAMWLQIRALEQPRDMPDDTSSRATGKAPPEAAALPPLRVSPTVDHERTTLSDQKPADAPGISSFPQVRAIRDGGVASPDRTQRPVSDARRQGSPDVVSVPPVQISVGQTAQAQPVQTRPAHARATDAPVPRPGSEAAPVAAPASVSGSIGPTERSVPENPVPRRQGVSADGPQATVLVQSVSVPAAASGDGRSSSADQPRISRRGGTPIVASRAGEDASRRPAVQAGISLAPLQPVRQPSIQAGRDSGGASNGPAKRDEPTVQVSIGRIEIREQRPPQPAPARPAPSPRLGLREYLDRRLREGRDE